MDRWLVLAMAALGLWTSSSGEQGGLQCQDCDDVDHPSRCGRSTVCQQNEICFTYKYTYSNITRYRLGCQENKVCDMIPVRPFLIGRRRAELRLWKRNNIKVKSLCYECCHSNNCNSGMCQGQSVTHTHLPSSTSTTTHAATTTPSSTATSTSMAPSTPPASTSTITPTHNPTTTSNTICPSDYVGFGGSCYMVVYKSLQWDSAKTACTHLGAKTHLVSVNSEQEQKFLAHLLNTEGFPAQGVWIGGYRDPFWRRWMWVDGSDLQYQSWLSPFPLDEQHRTSISMVNLDGSSTSTEWKWRNEKPDWYFAFICEMISIRK